MSPDTLQTTHKTLATRMPSTTAGKRSAVLSFGGSFGCKTELWTTPGHQNTATTTRTPPDPQPPLWLKHTSPYLPIISMCLYVNPTPDLLKSLVFLLPVTYTRHSPPPVIYYISYVLLFYYIIYYYSSEWIYFIRIAKLGKLF